MRRTYIAVLIALAAFVSTAGSQTLPTLPAEQHPSLLFSAADIPQLKERIGREPYSTWWQTTLSRATNVPATFTEERTKARYAKSLAFAYLMTDSTAFATQAVEIMKDMKFPPRDGDLGQPHNEGEVVALYAVAYDMLHTFLQDDSASLEEIRTILAEEAERIHEGIVIFEQKLGFITIRIRLDESPDPRNLDVIHLDNWHVRAYGGLGMAALVLRDHEGRDGATPQDWADNAFDLVTRSMEHQIEATDGGYAEGPFYSRYAADVYLPFMFALKNVVAVDLFSDPKIEKMHDWSLNLRLPNGRRPNIDDGHLDEFYGHYLAAVDADGSVHLWDWQNNSTGLYVREFSEMDAIALYDDGIVPTEPERGPSIFMPEAGDAVFRSDWSADATYMLLRGEHGRAREQGLAHEHPDETSFILYAGGEMLAVDAGYIDFTNHGKVNEGRNHSVILVDGQGPPLTMLAGEPVDGGNDAFIEDFFTSTFMDYAEVRAQYQNVDTRRRVMFPGKSYFVIVDEVRDDATHQYEWRLHGNGGGSSGGAYERNDNLARWTRDQAELLIYMPAQEGRTFTEDDTLHSFGYLEEPTHTVFKAQQSGANVEFLSVLYPRALDQTEPTFTAPEASGGQAAQITLDEQLDLTWVRTASADSTTFTAPAGQVDSDARFGLLRYAGASLQALTAQDVRFVRVGGTDLFSAADSIDISLEFGTDEITGFVRAADSTTTTTLAIPLTRPVEALTFAGTLSDTSTTNGVLSINLAGEGALRLALAAVADSSTETPADSTATETPSVSVEVIAQSDFDNDGIVGFQDFFQFSEAFGAPVTDATARFDLDGDGAIGFQDFFQFAEAFGESVASN
jgi:hypothetical protein